MEKSRPLPEPIRLSNLLHSARSRTEKKNVINLKTLKRSEHSREVSFSFLKEQRLQYLRFFYQAIRQNAQPALKSGKTFSPCKLWALETFSLNKGKNWHRRESEGCTLFTIATTLLQEASVSLIKSSGKPRRPDTDRKAKQVQNWHLPWMVIKHELRIHTFLSEFKTLTSITTLNETRHVEKQLQWYERFLFLL